MQLQYTQTLRALNLKATPKRLAILTLLGKKMAYAGPEDVWRALKEEFGRIGLPTVYRNMEELAARGVITKVVHPDRKLYYHFCPNRDHHHHFICLGCRRVEDVDACGLEKIDREIGERLGGTVISHLVQVNGLCRDCAAAQEGGRR